MHTFRANIDYALSEAHTTYGRIGIKVWICKGEVFGKRDLSTTVGSGTPNKGKGGLHHICVQVEDIDTRLKELKAAGMMLIDEEPRIGAHNCRIAFVHPKSTGGVLLELSEPQDGSHG